MAGVMFVGIGHKLLNRGLQPPRIIHLDYDLPRRYGQDRSVQCEGNLAAERLRQVLAEADMKLRLAPGDVRLSLGIRAVSDVQRIIQDRRWTLSHEGCGGPCVFGDKIQSADGRGSRQP